MSVVCEHLCEEPTKNWIDYTPTELRYYLLRNINKADCSFIINDRKKKSADKRFESLRWMPFDMFPIMRVFQNLIKNEEVIESYKWILSDMSPVLKDVLADEENLAKYCKLIEISDPNFVAILSYGHTKIINDQSFDLVHLYEIAKKYEIKTMSDDVLTMLQNVTNFHTINWIDFFRIAHMERKSNTEFYKLFQSIMPKMSRSHMEKELESNLKKVKDFDEESFDDFFGLLNHFSVNPSLCFKTAGAYLIKHVFNGKTPKSPEKQGNIIRNTVNAYMEKIAFEKMTLTDFKKGPGKSNLLDKSFKKRISDNISKKYVADRSLYGVFRSF